MFYIQIGSNSVKDRVEQLLELYYHLHGVLQAAACIAGLHGVVTDHTGLLKKKTQNKHISVGFCQKLSKKNT